jgi:hypothetical protein
VSWFRDETRETHRSACVYCHTATEWDADVDRVFAWKAEHERTCPWLVALGVVA